MGLTIGQSVGTGGVNAPLDVLAIGGALVLVGVDNGGVFGPPLTTEALGEAVAQFQAVQGLLPHPDGRVDPGGASLRRLNAILFPDEVGVRPLADQTGLATSVSSTVWAPDPESLASEYAFRWTSVAGAGQIHYFQLDEAVVPRWFGVLVPDGTVEFDRVHLFFHPTPAQAGHQDAVYPTLGSFRDIWHYLTDSMAAQFCAARTGRIMIMPLMTQSAAVDCGTFPQRWPEVCGCILGRLAAGVDEGARFQRVSSVVVSSFSSGIAYSHAFRTRAVLGDRLAGIIDFDSVISSYSSLSPRAAAAAARTVIKAQQTDASPGSLPALSAQGVFPLPRARWGGPYEGLFDANPGTAVGQIHGAIPQTMMHVAAQRTG